jgi:hypothetical protein
MIASAKETAPRAGLANCDLEQMKDWRAKASELRCRSLATEL